MYSFQSLRIQETGGVAQDHPTIPRNRRDAPPASVGERLGSVTNHLAAFEKFRNKRMLLEFLQDALRIDTRVRIIQTGHEAQRHQVVMRTVNPSATVLIEGQRIAHGVDHFTRRKPSRGQLPKLLDADAVGLGIAFVVELEATDQLLGLSLIHISEPT